MGPLIFEFYQKIRKDIDGEGEVPQKKIAFDQGGRLVKRKRESYDTIAKRWGPKTASTA